MMEKLTKERYRKRAAAKVAAAQKVLTIEIASLVTGADWRTFLDFQAMMHDYSANNVMSIFAQHARAYEEGRVPEPASRKTRADGGRALAVVQEISIVPWAWEALTPVPRTPFAAFVDIIVSMDVDAHYPRVMSDAKPLGNEELQYVDFSLLAPHSLLNHELAPK
jgi:hypothetical protein